MERYNEHHDGEKHETDSPEKTPSYHREPYGIRQGLTRSPLGFSQNPLLQTLRNFSAEGFQGGWNNVEPTLPPSFHSDPDMKQFLDFKRRRTNREGNWSSTGASESSNPYGRTEGSQYNSRKNFEIPHSTASSLREGFTGVNLKDQSLLPSLPHEFSENLLKDAQKAGKLYEQSVNVETSSLQKSNEAIQAIKNLDPQIEQWIQYCRNKTTELNNTITRHTG